LRLYQDHKTSAQPHIVSRDGPLIMFVHTSHRALRLHKQLLANGLNGEALHAGKSRAQLNRVLDQLRHWLLTVLLATHFSARGIHFDVLDLVVNVNPPIAHKDYLHRGRRTARAGESGTVVTLVLPEQRREVNRLMTVAGI
ncbi:hypothetical protein VM98_33605, partial [Streptomyces rubellomurinus subsp. indigoferus]